MDKRGRGWEGEEGEVMCIRGVEDGRVRKVRQYFLEGRCYGTTLSQVLLISHI